MHPLISRVIRAGFFLSMLDMGCHARADAIAQAHLEELLEMPKVGAMAQGGQGEALPPPRELEPKTMGWDEASSAPFCDRPLNCTRINRYEIWQLYEVGRQGRFRPRVIYSASGSFYLDDGRPYPWISTHALDFMPYAVSP